MNFEEKKSPDGKRLIDLYVYRQREERLEFLLLKRASRKIYSGQWRMIGGKVEKDEVRWRAALRELREETRLEPERFWCVPTINHFYEPQTDRIYLIPAFAAEVDPGADVVLDDEHQEYRWSGSSEIGSLVAWPEQIRIMELICRIVTNHQILDDWTLPVEDI